MGEYSVILADPPWQYSVHDAAESGQGTAQRHYNTVALPDIKRLPVAEFAAKDCALFMWATFPCLPEALDLMQAWGFQYKTVAFTWIKLYSNGKPVVGLGHYTRGNAEVCLLGVRGGGTETQGGRCPAGHPRRAAGAQPQAGRAVWQDHAAV